MAENMILIITEDISKHAINKKSHIDVLETILKEKDMPKASLEFKEKYDYILFIDECKYGDGLVNFLPISFVEGLKNKAFINELLLNPIFIEKVETLLGTENIIEVSILLKHIIRNNICEENFDFDNELEEMKKFNNLNDDQISRYKNKVYKAVESNYSGNSIIRKIKFRIYKKKIIRKAIYKILYSIIDNIKNTNELVFKEFVSIVV